jgi:hypothetical protein
MAEVTTDHEMIRKWAESKGGKPAAVERTHKGGDVGIIRIMSPCPRAPPSVDVDAGRRCGGKRPRS